MAPKSKGRGKQHSVPLLNSRLPSQSPVASSQGLRTPLTQEAPGERYILKRTQSLDDPGWVFAFKEHPPETLPLSSNSSVLFLSAPPQIPLKEKHPRISVKSLTTPAPPRSRRPPPGLPGAGGARGPGRRARPLPWERTGLRRSRGRREEARRQIQRETLSQDGVCEAAGCGVSAPRRGLCEAAPLAAAAAAATAAPPLRLPLHRGEAFPPRRYPRPRALRVVHRWQ